MSMLFLWTPVALACKCKSFTETERLENADAVFTARSLEKTEFVHSMLIDRFSPIELFKLDPEAEQFVPKTPHDPDGKMLILQAAFNECAFSFEEGKSYKVYAYVLKNSSGESYLSTNKCIGTTALEERPRVDQMSVMTKESCEQAGGIWRYLDQCDLPTTDAGTPCTDISDCQSVCVADEGVRGNKIIGKCFERTGTLGTCLNYVKNGKADGQLLCVD